MKQQVERQVDHIPVSCVIDGHGDDARRSVRPHPREVERQKGLPLGAAIPHQVGHRVARQRTELRCRQIALVWCIVEPVSIPEGCNQRTRESGEQAILQPLHELGVGAGQTIVGGAPLAVRVIAAVSTTQAQSNRVQPRVRVRGRDFVRQETEFGQNAPDGPDRLDRVTLFVGPRDRWVHGRLHV